MFRKGPSCLRRQPKYRRCKRSIRKDERWIEKISQRLSLSSEY
jgi:hypothetical protein